MTSYRTIRYERTHAVGVLTLARPDKRNAQNPAMWQELRALGETLTDDPDLRCLIVRGDGNSFSAGIDLIEGLGTVAAWADDPQDRRNHAEGALAAGTFQWIPRLPCPSVAAVQGHAYGAGLQLALSCDFRIFAASARVGLIETRFGLLPDMGATVRLPRIVGESRARELILLGESSTRRKRRGSGWRTASSTTRTSTPPHANWRGGWPHSRRSQSGAPAGHSRLRGTSTPTPHSPWHSMSSSRASPLTTSRRESRRYATGVTRPGRAARSNLSPSESPPSTGETTTTGFSGPRVFAPLIVRAGRLPPAATVDGTPPTCRPPAEWTS